MRVLTLFVVLSLLTGSRATSADVIDRAADGFTLKTVVTIAAPPEQVYGALVNIGGWWDAQHTYSGDSSQLHLDAKAGGCFCEALGNGGSVQHAMVVYAEPGRLLRLAGAFGPLQSMAVVGSMTWSLEKAGTGTSVTMTYAVGGYAPGGLAALAGPVDQVIGGQVGRLKTLIEQPRR